MAGYRHRIRFGVQSERDTSDGRSSFYVMEQTDRPVFAATMNLYTLIEAPNMQAYTQPHRMSGSPRIELIENGTMYSNLDDLDTKITYQKKGNTHQFHIVTHLVDSKQQFSSVGKEAMEIVISSRRKRSAFTALSRNH